MSKSFHVVFCSIEDKGGHRSKSLVFSIHAPLAAAAVVLEFLLAFVFRPGEEQLGNVRGRHLMTLSCLVSAK